MGIYSGGDAPIGAKVGELGAAYFDSFKVE
jgi:hypothetical protein